ncbi:hypothetical protein [Planctomicrobium piriforme]|uniref:hypothetical protein n=1 Tax=Planctomicrobium piriforme TaxID=1576369 RepID=UPI000B846218|nr:hypothetical protein [Planctomicrobium piriforme]
MPTQILLQARFWTCRPVQIAAKAQPSRQFSFSFLITRRAIWLEKDDIKAWGGSFFETEGTEISPVFLRKLTDGMWAGAVGGRLSEAWESGFVFWLGEMRDNLPGLTPSTEGEFRH